jgi:hypothetical protein
MHMWHVLYPIALVASKDLWNWNKDTNAVCFLWGSCELLVYVFSSVVTQAIWCRMVAWLVNNNLERMRKEAVMTYFDVISKCLPVVIEESHEKS